MQCNVQMCLQRGSRRRRCMTGVPVVLLLEASAGPVCSRVLARHAP